MHSWAWIFHNRPRAVRPFRNREGALGLGQSIAAHEHRSAAGTAHGAVPDFHTLIGQSPAFRAAVDAAHRVADYPAANVLLVGETGTGKELFARAIHYASQQAGEPFVGINCSAIPETLLESELFGHEKGAFTDARTPKRGLLEVAGRGTVMLDEVNELPLNLQPKLLRVLEERRVRRLGAVSEYDVNCRIVAATNGDLGRLVEDGGFRNDLFYRLSVLRIDLPPLRERDGDIDILVDHYLQRICQEHGLPPRHMAPDALTVLREHNWLGNVRELKNTLESSIVMCDGDLIRPEHIRLRKRMSHRLSGDDILANVGANDASAPTPPHAGEPTGWQDATPLLHVPPGGITLEAMERLLIQETLRRANGNRSLASRMLGVSRPTVIRKIERYGLA